MLLVYVSSCLVATPPSDRQVRGGRLSCSVEMMGWIRLFQVQKLKSSCEYLLL